MKTQENSLEMKLPAIVASLLMLLSPVLQACPSCFSADGKSREAYFWTALVMSGVPLALIVGLIWWMRKHLQSEKEQQHRDSIAKTPENHRDPERNEMSSSL